MARDRALEPAVGGEQQVDAGEKRPRTARAAEDPVQSRKHRLRSGIDIELRAKRGVCDRHHEPGRHTVPGGVAEKNGEPPVFERNEVVDVSADRVRDLVVRPDLPSGRRGHDSRNEARLEVPGELELVAEVDLVDELHRQKEHDDDEGKEQPAVVEIKMVLRRTDDVAVLLRRPEERRPLERKQQAEQRRREEDPPRRGEPPGDPEHHRVGGPEVAADPVAGSLELLGVIGRQLGASALPLAPVKP